VSLVRARAVPLGFHLGGLSGGGRGVSSRSRVGGSGSRGHGVSELSLGGSGARVGVYGALRAVGEGLLRLGQLLLGALLLNGRFLQRTGLNDRHHRKEQTHKTYERSKGVKESQACGRTCGRASGTR
jgi:hypothetical protein